MGYTALRNAGALLFIRRSFVRPRRRAPATGVLLIIDSKNVQKARRLQSHISFSPFVQFVWLSFNPCSLQSLCMQIHPTPATFCDGLTLVRIILFPPD